MPSRDPSDGRPDPIEAQGRHPFVDPDMYVEPSDKDENDLDDREEDWFDDSESSEEQLKLIAHDLRKQLDVYGVEGALGASHERVMRLWHEMAMNHYLVGDLTLHTLSHKQKTLRSPFERPSVTDLLEVAGTLDNPYRIRTELVEEVVPNLIAVGYKKAKAYSVTQKAPEGLAQAYRTFGWLLGQDCMADFPEILQSERVANQGKITRPAIFNLATGEIKRVLRIHESNSQKALYNPRISYETQAYENIRRTLQTALTIGEYAFKDYVLST